MSFKLSPTNCVDSYKTSHHLMYHEAANLVYSNFTPRSDRIARDKLHPGFYSGKLVWVGGYAALRDIVEIWNENFFSRDKETVCGEYARRLVPFAGGLEVNVAHFEELWDLQYLPIAVRMLEEGNHVNMGIPVLTIHNTHPAFFWLPNYLETWFSSEMWGPSTVATIAMNYRTMLEFYARATGSPMEFVSWQGHDFSCRGISGMHAAAKNGIGHLVSFLGTDTLAAVDYAEWAYSGRDTFVGGSVPASEHSVMTFDGTEGEKELFRRLITQVVPTGIVSLVSDGYDYWKVITEYAAELKPEILARKEDALGFAKVVFRPDSGDPVRIVAGYSENEVTRTDAGIRVKADGTMITENEFKGSVQCLWEIFGGTETDLGFKVLNSKVGMIYGDSITPQRCQDILQRLMEKGFASCNVVFGIGSYTYQYNTRDTFGFAMKATYAEVQGEGRVLFKAPKTDSGTKVSAKGLLRVVRNDKGDFVLEQNADIDLSKLEDHGELKLTFVNGEFVRTEDLATIRLRAGIAM